MKRSPLFLTSVAAVSVVLDQWSKRWATEHLAFREPLHVIGDLVTFTYTRNSGIAFGMFQGRMFPFYVFSVVAALAVFWMWVRHPHMDRVREWSLALILGGAVGNLIDRVRFGEVTDFILLAWQGHEFPVFNVADVCVTVGVALFALVWTREPDAPSATEDASTTVTAGGPAEDDHGSIAGAGGAGDGRGRATGPVAGEGPDRAQS